MLVSAIVLVLTARLSGPEKHDQLVIPVYSTDEDAWAKVDSFTSLGLPRSAMLVVDELYKEALKENNANQIVRCLIYKAGRNTPTRKNRKSKIS